jgi:hypothetical protein
MNLPDISRQEIHGNTPFHLNKGLTDTVNTRQKLGGNTIGPPKSLPEDGGNPSELLRNSYGAIP